jgi:hypothetical protein
VFKLKALPEPPSMPPIRGRAAGRRWIKLRHLAAQVPLDSPALMARCKAGMISQQVLKMIEAETQSRPTSIEFELAYQARVAMDRIRFAIKHTEQFGPKTQHMREGAFQLLDALERLASAERRFKKRFRPCPDAASARSNVQTVNETAELGGQRYEGYDETGIRLILCCHHRTAGRGQNQEFADLGESFPSCEVGFGAASSLYSLGLSR